jgi:hypothetical protein
MQSHPGRRTQKHRQWWTEKPSRPFENGARHMSQSALNPAARPQLDMATPVSTSSGQRSLIRFKPSPANDSAPLRPISNAPSAQPQTATQPIRSAAPQPDPAPGPGEARRTLVPPKYMHLEPPLPLSARDDDPVFAEGAAGTFLGVSAESLKKWRQRGKGPDYIQYGVGGPVRYTLSALKEFRQTHTIHLKEKK